MYSPKRNTANKSEVLAVYIIPQNDTNLEQISSSIKNFFSSNKIGALLKANNFKKDKGFPCLEVFKFVFSLVFSGKKLFRVLEGKQSANFGKEVIYRFLNSIYFNWNCLLLMLSAFVINERLVSLTDKKRKKVFIVDDSVYSRNRSKNVELMARVRDHCNQRYVKGFRMLSLGWSDGNTFIPVSFNLLSSAEPSNVLSPMNTEIDKRTNGYKRRFDSQLKETEAMYKLIDAACEKGIMADYVLFDSWFTFPAVIQKLSEMGKHTVAMVKAMPKVFYNFIGERMNLKQIYDCLRKKGGKSKILCSACVTIADGKIPLRIVFVRDRNRSKHWLAIISTDTKMTEEDIVKLYARRWDIEVFFKYCKSYLNLAKEFYCRNYDALVAHTTIVFSRYIMLAVESRNNNDNKTIGSLFHHCCEELQDISITKALQILMQILMSALKNNEIFMLSNKELESFLDLFISSLPSYFKGLMPKFSCES